MPTAVPPVIRLGTRVYRTDGVFTAAALVLVGVALLALYLWLIQPPVRVPAECARWYAAARSAADTAIVDARQLSTREPSPPTCGVYRRNAGARPVER